MAKIGLLFLNGGHWENSRLIYEQWVEESTGSIIKIPDILDRTGTNGKKERI